MRLLVRLAVTGIVLGCALGCNSDRGPKATAKSSAPVASVPPPPAPPKEPPLTPEAVTFETADKIPLSGTLYLAKDPAAPVLVFVHRFRGDRQEWAPMAARLAGADKRYTIVNFDLRGHGESKSSSGKKRLDWADMKEKDTPAMVEDVLAAEAYGFERSSGKSNRAVVVGSSLGAALAARAASEDARFVAVGLVSPGAAIQGFDVYHPFADVRMLPSFLAGAKDDNVCKEPLDALARMAKDQATVKSYDGGGHGAFGLARSGDALFTDLEAWLMSVWGAEPVTRELTPRPLASKKAHKG